MRLAAILNDVERIALAQAMLRDVLKALCECAAVSDIVVVSKEESAKRLAAELGLHYLVEEENDLSLAVAQGGRYVAANGNTAMLCIPGDVPLVSADELTRLIRAHPSMPALSLVSDRDGTGTNGLIVSPIALMPFSYGINSFNLHADAGTACGATVNIMQMDGLSLDIDTPEDIRYLMASGREAASVTYLEDIDVVSRLPPGHNIGHALLR